MHGYNYTFLYKILPIIAFPDKNQNPIERILVALSNGLLYDSNREVSFTLFINLLNVHSDLLTIFYMGLAFGLPY